MLTYVELLGDGGSLGLSTNDRISGVTITKGENLGTPINTGPSFGRLTSEVTFLGGHVGTWGTTYPRYLFTRTLDLTLANGSKTGFGGQIAFETDATSFDVRMYSAGGNSRFTLMVDGKVVPECRSFSMPNDGSLRWVTFDMAGLGLSPGYHRYQIDSYAGVDFGGLVIQPGKDVRPLSDSGPRLVFLGDSFSEGTGSATESEDLASIVSRRLGMPDLWQSAFGGTGWVATLNDRPNLLNRIEADGVNAVGDIYVIAMGVNDAGKNVTDNVIASLTKLTEGRPLAKIFVLNGFNVQAPGSPSSQHAEVYQQIKDAVALFPTVTLLDTSGVTFSKSDPTHPDPAGHWTLGTWISTQIERSLGIDGLVEQYLPGDVVGPIFLKGFDPTEEYTFTIFEDGVPSSRFEVVPTGDAFPILKLKDGVYAAFGPIAVSVHVQGSLGSDITADIDVNVRRYVSGDASSNYLTSNFGVAFLDGGRGNDTLVGTAGDDRLEGGEGNDNLDGRAGNDIMRGGIGNDFYTVGAIGDLVEEKVGEGYDVVKTYVNGFVLPDNFEGLDLLGTTTSGGGNSHSNYLRGNALNNRLFGYGGDDRLEGAAGNDRLEGGAGKDVLDGGAGDDIMLGGKAADTYYVNSNADVVTELAGEGADQVFASLSYILPVNVEILTLQGSVASGTGNSSANTIYGNEAVNLIRGMAGNDTLFGRGGNDTLEGGLGNDTLDGGIGSDTAVFGKMQASYLVTISGSVTYVRDIATLELDTLRSIELLQFSDITATIA